MSMLLHSPRLSSIHRRSFSAILLSKSSLSSVHLTPSLSPLHSKCLFSLYNPPPLLQSIPNSGHRSRDHLSIRAFDAASSETKNESDSSEKNEEPNKSSEGDNGSLRGSVDDYPSGELEFEEFGAWKSFVVKFRMLIAFPWERVRKGSVLNMTLRGQISEQLKSRFSSGLSLPQICENFVKAAYDPRISGIYLHIDPLNCGWGKVDEIRRHILEFKKSGKFIVGYAPSCNEKEYYLGCVCDELYFPPSAYFSLSGLTVQATFLGGVFEKVGIEPQVQRIGKYKSVGDQLMRKSISEENREMLTTLLDNIYGNWLDKISLMTGKTREHVESFINEGVYQVEKLKEDGWITNIQYDDEVLSMLKERLGVQKDKKLPIVDYRKYSRVRKWTVGLSGGKDRIAVIRTSGSISRVRSPLSVPSSGIISEQLIEKIRTVRGTIYSTNQSAYRQNVLQVIQKFNEAVNGFIDEGWPMLESDGIDDVTLLVNSSPRKLSARGNH